MLWAWLFRYLFCYLFWLAAILVGSAWRNRRPISPLSLTLNPMSVRAVVLMRRGAQPLPRNYLPWLHVHDLCLFLSRTRFWCGAGDMSVVSGCWLPGCVQCLHSHDCRGPMPCRVGFVRRAQKLQTGGKGLRCCYHKVEISHLSQPKSRPLHRFLLGGEKNRGYNGDIYTLHSPNKPSRSGGHRHQRVERNSKGIGCGWQG